MSSHGAFFGHDPTKERREKFVAPREGRKTSVKGQPSRTKRRGETENYSAQRVSVFTRSATLHPSGANHTQQERPAAVGQMRLFQMPVLTADRLSGWRSDETEAGETG